MRTRDTVSVKGLRDLNRAFALADRELASDFKDRLREAAEPVRTDAESLATSGIRRIGHDWSRMRIGATGTRVYVAPKKRSARGATTRKRPNLAGLLLGESMVPALDRNQPQIVKRVDRMLADIERDWARV